jgi:hypothetical protein
MNRSPHVVGGGLGSFGKQAEQRRVQEAKRNQEATRKEALRRLASAK